MTDKPHHTFFGRSPTRLGVAALVLASLAFVSQLLVVVIGVMAFFILFPLGLIAAVSGVLGLAGGICCKDWLGGLTGALGLTLAGWLVWSFLGNVTRF
jgi:hypothetical protein